ncbi:helix-turn-helix transcriptional regulator [Paenibacillus sp. 7124]|uniref:Helix-turn-helix transcriptional regulator n=1 Tax=Paenibacillus apii TaxID=1850370 RepID=A0A6M1PGV6_9BACL|nr:helix-turn-helix domain-containing protein [Paenibacillus apii]NGM82446.1 helix-turn-helix transcriptional regulator [Paenibacillus apii]
MNLQPAQAAFAQLLISGTLVHEGSFEEIRQVLGLQVNPDLVIVVSIDRYPEIAVGKPEEWKINIGSKLVEAVHKAISNPFLWVWKEEGILAVLLDTRAAHPHSQKYLLSVIRQIQKSIDAQGFSVSVGIGTSYDSPYLLHLSFEEANESMVDRFFQGNRIVYQYDKEKRVAKELKKPITNEEKMELLARVRIGDEEGSVNYLKILLDRIAHSYKFHVDMFKSEAVDLIMSLSRMVLDRGGDGSVILSENARMIQVLIGTVRYDNFINKMCDYWREIAKQARQADEIEASPIVRSAIKYIKENHQQKITLEKIAQYCYISNYHLAHVFKKEVGVGCVDFLNQVRIEKAVFLLETTDLSVNQIAGHVGFQDANYFTRKFKRYMNCSPTEYRAARLC